MSSFVILPSRLASSERKNDSICVPFTSSGVSAPSLFLSICDIPAHVGIELASLPGAHPAKNSRPSPATGVVQVKDGIPASDHRSAPVLRS